MRPPTRRRRSDPLPSRPDLVLFTGGFPYDGEESVIGPELLATAHRYGRIFIVPSRIGDRLSCQLPPNAAVVDLGWSRSPTREHKLAALRSMAAVRVLTATLARPSNWPAYLSGARTYLDILAREILKAQSLSAWITDHALQGAIFYDYWFENATLALALLREERTIHVALSRAHRFDIFDWAWSEVGKVPFRDFKAEHLDAIFVVSEHGAAYLRDRLPSDLRRKIRVSRLGVPLGEPLADPGGELPILVSCSSVTERKQVHLIPQALRAFGRPVRWIHFGDGPERCSVESLAATLPEHVSWEMRGRVGNTAVLDFYRANAVSAFVSTSSSEGIPVSMMEAQSFGIPIVSFAVGGIPELVLPAAGILLDPGAPLSELTAAFDEASRPERFDRAEIRRVFGHRYEASTAFGSFADSVISMVDGGCERHDSSVTVTTVLYNSERSLTQYAKQLKPALRDGSVRIVAVDNASPDRSAAVFRRLLPQAEVLSNDANLGFGAGCNRAWPEVRTRYWLLLNPDVLATAADIAALARWMDERPDIGVASPLLRASDGSKRSVARAHDSLWRPLLELLRLHKLVPEPWRSRWLLSGRRTTPQKIRGWVPGAALIVRTEAVGAVGLFDESLFIYGEDREWCWRMARAGWGIGVCEDLELVHEGGTSASATWAEEERVAHEVSGHLRATRRMRGAWFARSFALVNGTALWIESCDARRDRSVRAELRERAKAYLLESRARPGGPSV